MFSSKVISERSKSRNSIDKSERKNMFSKNVILERSKSKSNERRSFSRSNISNKSWSDLSKVRT